MKLAFHCETLHSLEHISNISSHYNVFHDILNLSNLAVNATVSCLVGLRKTKCDVNCHLERVAHLSLLNLAVLLTTHQDKDYSEFNNCWVEFGISSLDQTKEALNRWLMLMQNGFRFDHQNLFGSIYPDCLSSFFNVRSSCTTMFMYTVPNSCFEPCHHP